MGRSGVFTAIEEPEKEHSSYVSFFIMFVYLLTLGRGQQYQFSFGHVSKIVQ